LFSLTEINIHPHALGKQGHVRDCLKRIGYRPKRASLPKRAMLLKKCLRQVEQGDPACIPKLASVSYCQLLRGEGLSKPTDLVQGTLDLLLLKIIALEPMHGWAIAQRIRQMSAEVLQVGQGALYPALHKLEQQGWIKADWATSENGRRAKYYTLTRAGRKAMEQEAAQWYRLSSAISLIVRTT